MKFVDQIATDIAEILRNRYLSGALVSSVSKGETTTGSQKLVVAFEDGQRISIVVTPTRETRRSL
jgi:hypothetical protein